MESELREEANATRRYVRSRLEPLPSIVVASNDAHVRSVVERTLESVGYPVLSFGLDDRSLPPLEPNLPEVGALVLDFELPAMIGLELLQRVFRIRPTLPVILLATASPGHLRRQLSVLEKTTILQKPFLPSELLVEVDSVLRALTLLGLSTRSYSRAVP